MTTEQIEFIEGEINYIFSNKKLLEQAFTRKSFNIDYNYETLEFLGDKILSFILVKNFSDYFSFIENDYFVSSESEGNLTQRYIDLTRNSYLANIARNFSFNYLIQKDDKDKILRDSEGDIIESLIGAIAIDSNWNLDVLNSVIVLLIQPEKNFKIRYSEKTFKEMFEELCSHHNFSQISFEITEGNNNFKSRMIISNGTESKKLNQQGLSKKGAIEGLYRQAYIHAKLIWLNQSVDYKILNPTAQIIYLSTENKIKGFSQEDGYLNLSNNKKIPQYKITIQFDNNKTITGINQNINHKIAKTTASISVLNQILDEINKQKLPKKGILNLIQTKYIQYVQK